MCFNLFLFRDAAGSGDRKIPCCCDVRQGIDGDPRMCRPGIRIIFLLCPADILKKTGFPVSAVLIKGMRRITAVRANMIAEAMRNRSLKPMNSVSDISK